MRDWIKGTASKRRKFKTSWRTTYETELVYNRRRYRCAIGKNERRRKSAGFYHQSSFATAAPCHRQLFFNNCFNCKPMWRNFYHVHAIISSWMRCKNCCFQLLVYFVVFIWSALVFRRLYDLFLSRETDITPPERSPPIWQHAPNSQKNDISRNILCMRHLAPSDHSYHLLVGLLWCLM